MTEKKKHEHRYSITNIYKPNPISGWESKAIAQIICLEDGCAVEHFVELDEFAVD